MARLHIEARLTVVFIAWIYLERGARSGGTVEGFLLDTDTPPALTTVVP
jgi:hypothetical protein